MQGVFLGFEVGEVGAVETVAARLEKGVVFASADVGKHAVCVAAEGAGGADEVWLEFAHGIRRAVFQVFRGRLCG